MTAKNTAKKVSKRNTKTPGPRADRDGPAPSDGVLVSQGNTPGTVWIRNKSRVEVSDGRSMIKVGAIVEVDEPTAEILINSGHCELITENPDDVGIEPDLVEQVDPEQGRDAGFPDVTDGVPNV